MKEKTLERILDELEGIPFQTKIEVLANVFIRIGLGAIDTPKNTRYTTKNTLNLVMNDVEKNGENVANAIVRQGLLILTWLNKEKL